MKLSTQNGWNAVSATGVAVGLVAGEVAGVGVDVDVDAPTANTVPVSAAIDGVDVVLSVAVAHGGGPAV